MQVSFFGLSCLAILAFLAIGSLVGLIVVFSSLQRRDTAGIYPCPKCSHPVSKWAKACTHCGSPLDPSVAR